MFSPKMFSLSELDNGTGRKFLRNLANGDFVGYKADVGNFPGVFHGEIKQMAYGEQREFARSYKTALCKEDALRKVIGGDLEGCL